MKIYTFSTGDSNKFAYAYGYRPFGEMSFEDHFPEYLKERRHLASMLDLGPPGLQVGDAGAQWPDIMYCGNPPPSFVFSEKVLTSLGSHDISPYKVTPIPISSIASKKLRDIVAPNYFVVEAFPGIRVDYAASGFVVDSNGNPDQNAPQIQPSPILQYDPASWSGADLFCQSNGHGGPYYLDLLCTDRLREIAKLDGWTNAAFNRVRMKGINPFTGKPE
jgi:hypothetical protein